MEVINRVINQVQAASMISPSTQDKYKCEECHDSSWIIGENGARRCKCFALEVIQRRWKKFGVSPSEVKLLKDYETNTSIKKDARNSAINYIKEFDTIKEQRNSSIAFLGQPGAGKTHLALAIGKALLERIEHVEVIYMPYLEAVRELKANANEDEAYNKIQSRYISCELLIIDDLFKDKVKKGQLVAELKETDMKHIYPIINQRYINHKPTIYNSECNANMLLDLDEALGGRIIESCKGNIIIFKYGKENNYRLEGI
jgi:DNA replication protein DnaC